MPFPMGQTVVGLEPAVLHSTSVGEQIEQRESTRRGLRLLARWARFRETLAPCADAAAPLCPAGSAVPQARSGILLGRNLGP